MTQRKILASALAFAALAALASASVDLIRNRRWDGVSLSLAVVLAISAGWVYTRSVS